MTPLPPIEGQRLLVADLLGTIALVAVTILAAFTTSTPAQVIGLVVAGVLFVGGCGAFAVGFVRAAGRSRTEAVDLAGLFYLTGSAPDAARRWFLGLWFAQIAVAVAAIAVSRPPFAVMAPVWGIGIITWWASLHASFSPRQGRESK